MLKAFVNQQWGWVDAKGGERAPQFDWKTELDQGQQNIRNGKSKRGG